MKRDCHARAQCVGRRLGGVERSIVTRLRFHIDRATIPQEHDEEELSVLLYGANPPYADTASIGASLLEEASRFGMRPSAAAMDLIAIAMAVTAAEIYIPLTQPRTVGRGPFEIVLPLAEPDRWRPLASALEKALLYLSGDTWSFDLRGGGVFRPRPTLLDDVWSITICHDWIACLCSRADSDSAVWCARSNC